MNHHPSAAPGALAGIVALLATACAPANSPALTYDSQACAEEALRRGPAPEVLSSAVARFSNRCSRLGEASSCSLHGVLLELGLGVRADPPRARKLFRGACEAGNARACGNLGDLLLADTGPGTPPDVAITLLRISCEAGHGRHCATLCRTYAQGTFVPRAPAVAASWFERACQRGAASACVGFADLIERGDVDAEPARRVELLTLACANGDEDGCARLSRHPRPPGPAPLMVGLRER